MKLFRRLKCWLGAHDYRLIPTSEKPCVLDVPPYLDWYLCLHCDKSKIQEVKETPF